jgi:hypothetical protein
MATNTYVPFNLEEAQTLADYTSIASDLSTSREFATTMLDENQKPAPIRNVSLSDPFMVATIIRYGRAFASGARLPSLYEEGKFILTDQQLSKHEQFIHIRNKYIAHSVNAFEESQPIARFWAGRVQEEGINSIECNQRRVAGLSEQDLTDIIDLTTTWLQYVEEKLSGEKARLLTIVRKIPLAHFLQSAPEERMVPDTSQPQKQRAADKRRKTTSRPLPGSG